MARPAFIPTDEQRMTVRIMAACGFPQDQIAERVIDPKTGKKIDPKTLRRAFRSELDAGIEAANAIVAQSLFKKATGNGPQSVTACIFWLKTRAGWVPKDRVELTGQDGAPIQTQNENAVDENAVRAIVQRIREEF